VSQSYNCFFDLFPDARAGVILLTNYSDEGRLLELVAALYDHVLGLPHEGIVFLDKPARTARPPERKELEHYAGSYLNVESAGLAAFGLGKGGLWLEREGSTLQLVPSGEGRFFAEVSETYRVTVSFSEDSQGNVTHVMISGAPYFPITLDPNFQPDPRLLKGCEGDYRDPSNLSPEEVFRVRAENGVLYIAEGDHEVRGRAISDYAFLSELGLIEFEDGERAGVNVLKWGKATRYHRIEPAGRQTRNL
jgi:hypothetical protein